MVMVLTAWLSLINQTKAINKQEEARRILITNHICFPVYKNQYILGLGADTIYVYYNIDNLDSVIIISIIISVSVASDLLSN